MAAFQNDIILPLAVAILVVLGALFKVGRYISYPNYISRMHLEHVRAGYAWTDQLRLDAKSGCRSPHALEYGCRSPHPLYSVCTCLREPRPSSLRNELAAWAIQPLHAPAAAR